MKLYYDLHIHTGLSPCGDESMTPNNIVNMALLKELDCIAITDHNTCRNVTAVMEAARETPLLVIPGMEVETAEEVHVVCLFPTLEGCLAVEKAVWDALPSIPNKPEIFGRQILFDSEDNETGELKNLLLTASGLDLYSLVELVHAHRGAAIPAHIDRSSYSVLSNLGFLPADLPVTALEIAGPNPESFLEESHGLLSKSYHVVQNSDAHYLGSISERAHYLEFPQQPGIDEIIQKLR